MATMMKPPLLSHEAVAAAAAHPVYALTAIFAAWKGFLLAVALGAAIGPDYDTSTSLFLERMSASDAAKVDDVSGLAGRLTRWDALYFVHAARRGYVYEQQWAFGMGLPAVVRGVLHLCRSCRLVGDAAVPEPLVAIAVSHLAHLIAALALHRLTVLLFGNKRLAFVASVLHILSPAGLFLSAPYAESPFACLSFVGNLLFATSLKHNLSPLHRNGALIGAGVVFGLATAFRSNGLFAGLLFAAEAVRRLLAFTQRPSLSTAFALVSPVIGGICVAIGSIFPQAIAWMRYCSGDLGETGPRPWCSRAIPSIYTFVQEEYWNVGFLRYWTLDQLPLFLLASPMLVILIRSGLDVILSPYRGLRQSSPGSEERYHIFVRTLAASQALVATLAITNFHVQIIARLSSGYPVWYWWVASCLSDQRRQRMGRAIVVFIVMYGSIQGALFASFLPPA